MSGPAAILAGRLAREAEAVCRTYLSNGRRSGRYWLVGDVANTPGRSLFVRLIGPEDRDEVALGPSHRTGQVAEQIETPCSPDPIMRRPRADREEKRSA